MRMIESTSRSLYLASQNTSCSHQLSKSLPGPHPWRIYRLRRTSPTTRCYDGERTTVSSWSSTSQCQVRTRCARDLLGETLTKTEREGGGAGRGSLRLRCRSKAVRGERAGRKTGQEDPQTAEQLRDSRSQVGGEPQNKDRPVGDSSLGKNGPALVPPPPSSVGAAREERSFCTNTAEDPEGAAAGARQGWYSATHSLRILSHLGP